MLPYAIEYCELNYRDIANVAYDESRKAIRQATYGGQDIFYLLRYGKYIPEKNEGLPSFVLPSHVLDKMCGYYMDSVIKDVPAKNLLGSLAKALSEHNLRNYSNSLVMSWFIIESHIGDLWKWFIKDREITGRRKDRLNGRDYTASIKTEILETHGVISRDRFDDFNLIRGKRNKIAHEFGKVSATREDSTLALEKARDVIQEKLDLKFPFSTTGFPVHGL